NSADPGWQQEALAQPVAITANTTFVVSYFTPNGGYAYTYNYFATNGVQSGPLTPPPWGKGGYCSSRPPCFPPQTHRSSNYWADVLFSASGADTSDSTASVASTTAAPTTTTAAPTTTTAAPVPTTQRTTTTTAAPVITPTTAAPTPTTVAP